MMVRSARTSREAAEFVMKHMKSRCRLHRCQTAPPGRRMGHAGAIISGSAVPPRKSSEAFEKAGMGSLATDPTSWPSSKPACDDAQSRQSAAMSCATSSRPSGWSSRSRRARLRGSGGALSDDWARPHGGSIFPKLRRRVAEAARRTPWRWAIGLPAALSDQCRRAARRRARRLAHDHLPSLRRRGRAVRAHRAQ